jgi:EAL domain-containing protein (putative c-di-GMP-specific phosphodiesterase class I)
MARVEYLVNPNGQVQRIELSQLPFVFGREANAQFIVPNLSVSKTHAELYWANDQFWIRDLGSSNGTFVNGERIRESALKNGDIIHLAHAEFRFFNEPVVDLKPENAPIPVTELVQGKTPPSVMRDRPLLQEMIRSRSYRVIYQPIVDLQTRRVVGFEALGRGCSLELSSRPAELFRLASLCTLAGELSRAFCSAAVQESSSLSVGEYVFCNLHPDEFKRLLPVNMGQFLPKLPDNRKLVLEVPEDVHADSALLRELRDQLRTYGVGLGFDDFGVGQSRIADFADVPPDFIKLDIRLVRDIDVNDRRRDVVRALCEMAHRLNVCIIAEGIERQEELETCKQLGCQLGQGFLLGHPELLG